MPFEKGNANRWKKGESGNPSGRPKGSLSIKDTMRQYMDQKVKDVDPALVAQIAGKDKNFAKKYGNKLFKDAYAIALLREGLKGDFRVLEHLEGKPPQDLNIGGQEDNPIYHQFNEITSTNNIDNKPKNDQDDEE